MPCPTGHWTFPTDVSRKVAFPLLLQGFVIPNLSSEEIFPINPVVWSLLFELVANLAHRQFNSRLTTKRLAILTGAAALVFFGASVYFGGAGIGPFRREFPGGFVRVAWGYSIGILLYRISINKRFSVLIIFVISVRIATAMLLFVPPLGVR